MTRAGVFRTRTSHTSRARSSLGRRPSATPSVAPSVMARQNEAATLDSVAPRWISMSPSRISRVINVSTSAGGGRIFVAVSVATPCQSRRTARIEATRDHIGPGCQLAAAPGVDIEPCGERLGWSDQPLAADASENDKEALGVCPLRRDIAFRNPVDEITLEHLEGRVVFRLHPRPNRIPCGVARTQQLLRSTRGGREVGENGRVASAVLVEEVAEKRDFAARTKGFCDVPGSHDLAKTLRLEPCAKLPEQKRSLQLPHLCSATSSR